MDAVPYAEREHVASALLPCSVVALPGGSTLGGDQLEAVALLAVEEGVVFVSVSKRDWARRIVVSLAGPSSILVAPAADERLEALADARLTLISARTYTRLLEVRAAATVIVEALECGLRDCRESLAQFGSQRHADRVREKLIQLASSHGKVGTDGLLLNLPLTHELLADMVGSTRETVTRALGQLAHEGLIQHEPGRYRITVPRGAAPLRNPNR